MADKKTLAEHVQDLPAELYNNVLDYTLNIDEDEVFITKGFKMPVQLQINKATRAAVAEKFYKNTKFVYDDAGARSYKFFVTLTKEHAWKIRKLASKVEDYVYGHSEKVSMDTVKHYWNYCNVQMK